jgi:hypothetical protein
MRRKMASGALLLLLGGLPFFTVAAGPTGKEVPGGGWVPFANCKGPKISVAGRESNYGGAVSGAIANWQEEAAKSAGSSFARWDHSAMRAMACQPRGGGIMSRRFVCTATALPCP